MCSLQGGEELLLLPDVSAAPSINRRLSSVQLRVAFVPKQRCASVGPCCTTSSLMLPSRIEPSRTCTRSPMSAIAIQRHGLAEQAGYRRTANLLERWRGRRRILYLAAYRAGRVEDHRDECRGDSGHVRPGPSPGSSILRKPRRHRSKTRCRRLRLRYPRTATRGAFAR